MEQGFAAGLQAGSREGRGAGLEAGGFSAQREREQGLTAEAREGGGEGGAGK